MMSIQRIHTGWNQKDKERKISQVAGVVAVNIWKISKKTLLNLENEGFEGDTWESRLKILCELSFFQIYILFNELLIREEPNRENILKDVAKKIELTLIENVRELEIKNDEIYKEFYKDLNQRLSEYTEYEYVEGPSYKSKIMLGNALMPLMGSLDNNWIRMYVIDLEVPKMMTSMHRVVRSFYK